MFQYLKGRGLRFLDRRFPRQGSGHRFARYLGWGYGGQTFGRGDWVDGKPSTNPADQVNAWKKQISICEHELPGTARHDPARLPAEQNGRLAGSPTGSERAARHRYRETLISSSKHEYPPARIQDKALLAPILEGSIAFTRAIDEAAAAMYALQHEVLHSQDIPIQGVGREAYRS